MKSVFGDNLQISLFGESHSAAIGAVITGLAPGIRLDLDFIESQMEKRRARGRISTKRQEPDKLHFVSGYFNGCTTGTPLCLLIENTVQRSGDYEKTKNLPRPSHADYTAQEKYLGYQDYRGGGHFSGRLTAPIVAAGAICMQVLRDKGIRIGTHISALHGIADTPFAAEEAALLRQLSALEGEGFPTLDAAIGEEMVREIERAAAEGDSLGGILETAVVGLPAGIGEPFFGSVESKLSALLYSVPGIKGVEFGLGFGFAGQTGSEANDPFFMEGDRVKTASNHNGGINGGITNGMPLLFRMAVRPTASIYQVQKTVDLSTRADAELQIAGRHDPAIIHRARVVADAVTAIGLCDLFCERYGYLWMTDVEQKLV